MSPNEENLRVASINANTAFISNIDSYISFLRTYQIHILLVQEAGPLPSPNNTSTTHDLHPHFSIKAANYYSFTRKTENYPHTQLILCADSIIPFVTQHYDNSDLPSQLIHLSAPYNINIGNVYLDNPTETRKKKLESITSSIENKDFLILGGDFNALLNPKLDYFSTKNTFQTKSHCLLKECIKKRKMIDTFRYCHPNKLDFSRWTVNKTSKYITGTRIDYLLTSKNLKRKISQSKIIKDSDIQSDHLPILLEISDVVVKNPKKSPSVPSVKSSDWNQEWADLIDLKIQDISKKLPQNREQLNGLCQQLTEALQSLYSLAQAKRAQQSLFVKSNRTTEFQILKKKRKELQTKKQKELKKQEIDRNLVFELVKELNQCNKRLSKIRIKTKRRNTKRKIDEMLQKKNFDSKIIYKLLNEHSINFAPHFVLKDNKIISNEEKVKEEVRHHFQELFNPKPAPEDGFDELIENCPSISDTKNQEYLFSTEEIKDLLTQKSSTAPGIDKITFDAYKFLAKHHKNTVFQRLEILYQGCYHLSMIPQQWEEGKTILLPKQDSHLSLDNWRPITLLTTMYKGYTSLLNKKITKSLEDFQLLPWNQFGFRKNHNTSLPILSLIKMISDAKSDNHPLCVAYYDFRKAFDSIHHGNLLKIMRKMKFSQKTIASIQFILENSTTRLKTAYGETEIVRLQRGVKQGDPLSPTLFAICLVPLSFQMNSETSYLNHMLFADDLVTITKKLSDYTTLSSKLQIYIPHLTLELNLKKSATTSFLMPKPSPSPILHLEAHQSYKYLGVPLNLDLNFDSALKKVEGTLHSKLSLLEKKRYLTTDQKIKIINCMLIPAASYILSHVNGEKSAKSMDLKITNFLNRQLKLHYKFPSLYWTKHRKVRSIFLNSLANKINRLTQVVTHPILKSLNWKNIMQDFANLYKINFNLKTPSYNIFLFQTEITEELEIYTDASLQNKQGSGAIIAVQGQQVHKSSHQLCFPANSTNLEVQTVVIALQKYQKYNLIFYIDSLNTVNWIQLFLKGETKKFHGRALNLLEFLIQVRLKNGLKTEVHHVYSHLLESPKKAQAKIEQLKKKFGDKLPQILKYNQMADKLAGKTCKNLQALEFDEFSPKVFFNHPTEPTTYTGLGLIKTTCVAETGKLAQLISSPFVNWNIYQKLSSILKDITIRSSSSGLWTRARIHKAFPESIKITDDLCSICQVKADHDHIFTNCKALQTLQHILPLPVKSQQLIIQRGLPDFSKYSICQNNALGILNKWKLHCLISWNNIKSIQQLKETKQWKQIIDGPSKIIHK